MTNQRILIVEPSMFRRDEIYVLGPFGRFKAWWKAQGLISRYPYGEIQVVPATAKVMQGDRVLWEPEPPALTSDAKQGGRL